jgi:hypothetical protein
MKTDFPLKVAFGCGIAKFSSNKNSFSHQKQLLVLDPQNVVPFQQ